MDLPKIKTFHTDEVLPILSEVKGPVDSFVVRNDREVVETAAKTGAIAPGSFRNCAVFGDDDSALEQKRLRYETKRAKEIQLIFAENDPTGLAVQLMNLYVDQTMARAVLVEGARKYTTEREEGTLVPRHEELYSRSIDEAQAELFPAPEAEIFEYALSKVMQKAGSVDADQAASLYEKYPRLQREASAAPEAMLSPETRGAWHTALHDRYDPAFAEVRSQFGEEELSNASLARATRLFMEQAGLPLADGETEGWTVVEDENVAGFKVDAGLRTVICGRRKREITWDNFERLMAHEILIHAVRAENGRNLGFEAFQNGLPGYQEPEEGLGVLIEKLWAGEDPDVVGRDHFRYVAVCYADGQFDGVKHTESETLEFVADLIAAQKQNGLNDEVVKETSRKTAVDHVKRAFRGMPEGKVMYSNLAYLSGKLKMMAFIEQSDLSPLELLEYLQQAKINPMDESHKDLLERAKQERANGGV